MEKRHKYQEKSEDQDSAISIGSLLPSLDSLVLPTDSAEHAAVETTIPETPPDSFLGESGIGLSFPRF